MAVYDLGQVQREMDRCGVAWFKMDEVSGNLVDSKGSFVGTNNGTTVVAGVSGNARSFNGTSNSIQFNSKVFPLGNKSIRFKIKTSGGSARIFSHIVSSSQYGDAIDITVGGTLLWRSFNNNVNPRFSLTSSVSINDNQWHDVLLTWDGTTVTGGVKMYIDEMVNPNVTGTSLSTETIAQSNNLIVGMLGVGGGAYLNGQLDELEIYSDAINPYAYKMLISSNGEYLKYSDRTYEWDVVSTSLPDAPTFTAEGMNDLSVLNSKNGQSLFSPMVNDGVLGSGKVFKSEINLSDIIDVSTIVVNSGVPDKWYTQYLMNKCGVGWFKMDEPAGNLLDSKGAFIGTNNGTTVVEGYSGNARSFNGTSSFIQFDGRITPLGKKSIRFKIKRNGVPSTVIETIYGHAYATASHHGDHISITDTGSLRWVSMRANSAGWRFGISPNLNICDNQWHDILLTWDGTTDSNTVKIYIDDMNTPKTTGTAIQTETTVQSYNLGLGKNFDVAVYFFNGQLDELEIYNEVISPFYKSI